MKSKVDWEHWLYFTLGWLIMPVWLPYIITIKIRNKKNACGPHQNA